MTSKRAIFSARSQLHSRAQFHAAATTPAARAHLEWWMREIADQRTHGTTGEAPLNRFIREEARRLRPLNDKPSFLRIRELSRRVASHSCVEVDTNQYSVPWRLIGSLVIVIVSDNEIRVLHASTEVARHAECKGRRECAIKMEHLSSIAAGKPIPISPSESTPAPIPELLRLLAE